MKVTNYLWLAQGKLPKQKRISPAALQRKVNEVSTGGYVQVVCPHSQAGPETVNALIQVDFNHEFENDPNAIFVIRSDSVDNRIIQDFLVSQIPLLENDDRNLDPRILLCEFVDDNIENMHLRFQEGVESGVVSLITSREELIRKIANLIQQMSENKQRQ